MQCCGRSALSEWMQEKGKAAFGGALAARCKAGKGAEFQAPDNEILCFPAKFQFRPVGMYCKTHGLPEFRQVKAGL